MDPKGAFVAAGMPWWVSIVRAVVCSARGVEHCPVLMSASGEAKLGERSWVQKMKYAPDFLAEKESGEPGRTRSK